MPERREWSTAAWVAGFTLAGLVLRLAFLRLVEASPLVVEEIHHLQLAQALLGGGAALGEDERAPGLVLYLALWGQVFKLTPQVARLAVACASAAIPPFVFLLGRRLVDRKTGLVAAALAAIYPNFVFFGASLWGESLYLSLLLPGIVSVLGARNGTSLPHLAIAGVVLGLASLTRDIGLFFLVCVAGWLLLTGAERRDGARRAALCVLLAGLVILPWTIRINGDGRGFAPITRTSGCRLFVGNCYHHEIAAGTPKPRVIGQGFRAYAGFGESASEREAEAYARALRTIRERLPAWPLEKLTTEIPDLVTPNSFPAGRLLARPGDPGAMHRWAYRLDEAVPGRTGLRTFLSRLSVAGWVIVAVLGFPGAVLAVRRRPEAWLVILLFLAHVAPTLAAFSCSRYRLPLIPVLLIGVAALSVRGRSLWREASGRRRVTALATAALLASLIVYRWPTVLTAQWG